MQRVQSIQSLRGVAALAVLLHHTGLMIGAWGVDLFFVISGFIIMKISPGAAPAKFAFDRFWRVFPLYWILSAPFFVAAVIQGINNPLQTFSSLTLLPGGVPYLLPGWSLIYEVIFYIAAVVVLATGKWRPMLGLFAACLIANILSGNLLLAYLGNPLILEFLCGVAIARLPKVGRLAAIAALVGGAVALLISPDLGKAWQIIGPAAPAWRALLWGLPCAMIVLGAVALDGPKWPLTKLGDASYSLYLAHYGPATLLPAMIGIPLALGLAFIVHHWIEKPLLKAKPKLASLRRAAA